MGKVAAFAAEMHKPDQQTILLPSAFHRLLPTTDVRKIQGIGYKSRKNWRLLAGILPHFYAATHARLVLMACVTFSVKMERSRVWSGCSFGCRQ